MGPCPPPERTSGLTEPRVTLPAAVSAPEAVLLLTLQLSRLQGGMRALERLVSGEPLARLNLLQARQDVLLTRFRAVLAQLDGGYLHEQGAAMALQEASGLVQRPAEPEPRPSLFGQARQRRQRVRFLEEELAVLLQLSTLARERFAHEALADEFGEAAGMCLDHARLLSALLE